ncbi:MAG: AAA family ATPase [Okeania sp. SIO2F4]|uniref:DEAD/DEAH box helicase family protein n=1 Tax=Okeania sp. SIO2F4 TaxID=2607790 RepID=UPI001428F3F3|nr:AAA family ATPase [Okeania sp. SIO2F4]NES04645.1 AAA family ATPase [Okeania sp. SIO2F4]
MAILVPDDLNTLPQKLTEGEKALTNALCEVLDDNWTVYVQPYLNGLKPDIIIFCKDAGMGIFEVKDWTPDVHRIQGNKKDGYQWEVRAKDTGKWHKEDCPFKQVKKYHDSIFKYEIPILGSKKILNDQVYGLIRRFVYFHKHKTADIKRRVRTILDKHSHVFGWDDIEPKNLRQLLEERNLRHGSKFANLMQEIGLADRLANALAFPKHGMTNIEHLLNLTKKQREILNKQKNSRRTRVKGAAGSGKTLLLAHKAAIAASEEKRVLVVCYNITLVNYIKDLVKRLARYYGKKNGKLDCYRKIEVGHYHRIFTDENSSEEEITDEEKIDRKNTRENNLNDKTPVDVLLIDEGQDFKSAWVKDLQNICQENYEFMFCEDRRQNIYGCEEIRRESIPKLVGAPTKLKESFRIPEQTAKLANFLADYTKLEIEDNVKSMKPLQGNLFVRNFWFNGTYKESIEALKVDVKNLTKDRNNARADIAILVCSVKDGWEVCKVLNQLSLPYQPAFESQEENEKLKKFYAGDSKKIKDKVDEIRRGYKTAFWMQGGRIKISTIHSFKGWELSNILVFFNPDEKQQNEHSKELLYTGITRSQECLTVYNASSLFKDFGDAAISEGCIEAHPMYRK